MEKINVKEYFDSFFSLYKDLCPHGYEDQYKLKNTLKHKIIEQILQVQTFGGEYIIENKNDSFVTNFIFTLNTDQQKLLGVETFQIITFPPKLEITRYQIKVVFEKSNRVIGNSLYPIELCIDSDEHLYNLAFKIPLKDLYIHPHLVNTIEENINPQTYQGKPFPIEADSIQFDISQLTYCYIQ